MQKIYCQKKAVTVGCLVENGKDVISVAEIQNGFAGSSKQFLLVVSNKYIGKSWAKWRAHGTTINPFIHCVIATEIN